MPRRTKTFPKKVFVSVIHERDPVDDFLTMDEQLQDIEISTGKKIKVAVYELMGIFSVKNVNTLTENKDVGTD